MPLTGPQLDPIASAIQAAYDRDELRKVLVARLNINFDAHAPEKGYEDQLWTFLGWANRQDRIPELVRTLQAEKPTNTALQAVRATLEPGFTLATAPVAAPPLAPATIPAGTTIHVAGDYIVGNVGSNSPNVAIGKDITQTVTTPAPSPVTPTSTIAPPSKPAEPPEAKSRGTWLSSVWTLVLAPIIVGVVLLLVTQWVGRKDDATATPTPTAAGPLLTIGEGETTQATFGAEQVIISVPTYQNLMAGFDYRGQDIQVSVVAPAASRFVTMTVGSCVQAGDYTVSLVDLTVSGPQRGDFVVTKPMTTTTNLQCQ